MSEAQAPIDPDEALLAELAAQDMALARHVNAQALATTDPETLNGLVRSAQRLARSIRQSIAAKAKLKGDHAAQAKRAAIWAPPPREGPPLRFGALSDQADLEEAALTRIRAEYDPSEAEPLEADLSDVIDDVWTPAFAALSPADQVESLLDHIRDNYFEAAEADEDSEAEDAQPDAQSEDDPPRVQAPPEPDPISAAPADATAPEPEPELQAEPAAERPPDQPPGPPPRPYVPPWEQLRPGQSFPGRTGW